MTDVHVSRRRGLQDQMVHPIRLEMIVCSRGSSTLQYNVHMEWKPVAVQALHVNHEGWLPMSPQVNPLSHEVA
jgi:hypothetical protein